MKLTERLDKAQQDHGRLSIALATYKKYSDDKSSNLATMIAFWAFFSIFPLLLVVPAHFLLRRFMPKPVRPG